MTDNKNLVNNDFSISLTTQDSQLLTKILEYIK